MTWNEYIDQIIRTVHHRFNTGQHFHICSCMMPATDLDREETMQHYERLHNIINDKRKEQNTLKVLYWKFFITNGRFYLFPYPTGHLKPQRKHLYSRINFLTSLKEA